jgi:hypothetical protein
VPAIFSPNTKELTDHSMHGPETMGASVQVRCYSVAGVFRVTLFLNNYGFKSSYAGKGLCPSWQAVQAPEGLGMVLLRVMVVTWCRYGGGRREGLS